jgi:small basic protein (TIGR04137 family)
MSVDPSLKLKNALTRHRNVLTRAERIEALKEEERWSDGTSVLGLPKVAHRKSAAGKKTKTEAEAAAAAAPGAPAAAAAAPAAPVAGAPKAAGAAKGAAAPKAAGAPKGGGAGK